MMLYSIIYVTSRIKVIHLSDLFLSKPSPLYHKQYNDMIRDFKTSGEDPIPWVLRLDATPFIKLLRNLEWLSAGVSLPHNLPRCHTYWLVSDSGRLLGAVTIRHGEDCPPDDGRYCHIAFGIRPSQRRKGYGTIMLRLALAKARELHIKDVYVECDASNTASEKVILKNGGVLQSEPAGRKRFLIADTPASCEN